MTIRFCLEIVVDAKNLPGGLIEAGFFYSEGYKSDIYIGPESSCPFISISISRGSLFSKSPRLL